MPTGLSRLILCSALVIVKFLAFLNKGPHAFILHGPCKPRLQPDSPMRSVRSPPPGVPDSVWSAEDTPFLFDSSAKDQFLGKYLVSFSGDLGQEKKPGSCCQFTVSIRPRCAVNPVTSFRGEASMEVFIV